MPVELKKLRLPNTANILLDGRVVGHYFGEQNDVCLIKRVSEAEQHEITEAVRAFSFTGEEVEEKAEPSVTPPPPPIPEEYEQ